MLLPQPHPAAQHRMSSAQPGSLFSRAQCASRAFPQPSHIPRGSSQAYLGVKDCSLGTEQDTAAKDSTAVQEHWEGKNPAAQSMLFVCSNGKKGNGVKNSIVLFILWAVSAEMCFVSTLSSAASSALLSPFPRTVLMIPRDFLLKHAHRDALRVCPRAHLRAAPSALPGCSPVQVWGTAAQLSGMCPQNCWKQTPSCALLPGDTCPECSLQRRNVCEHGIKCKPFPLEGCFTVQNNTCNHPQSISWSTGHGRAPEKPHSLLAGQGSRTRYPREGLAMYNTLTPIPEAKL